MDLENYKKKLESGSDTVDTQKRYRLQIQNITKYSFKTYSGKTVDNKIKSLFEINMDDSQCEFRNINDHIFITTDLIEKYKQEANRS